MADQLSDPGKHKPRSEGANAAEAWRTSQPYFDAVWQLVGGVGMGVGGGFALDRWLHTTPWLLVAGSVVGMTAGFVSFFRSIVKASSRK